MLHVFICEDDPRQRESMETLINKYILLGDYDMDITLSAGSPAEMLDHLKKYGSKNGLYFLDVDLQSEINGIVLAAKIRALDVSATIVFITTHAELSYLVFKHKVEAMDYIIKDSPAEEIETRVMECMKLAYTRYLGGKHSKSKYFTVKAGDQMLNIPYDEILFFETHLTLRNKIFLHTINGKVEFRGAISEVTQLGPPFYQCHQSFVVNIKKIERVDRGNREVEMIDGEIIPISVRKMAEFLKYVEAQNSD